MIVSLFGSRFHVVALILLVICFLIGPIRHSSAEEELCCSVSWQLLGASGTVPFIVYTCCSPPMAEYCTVYVTSDHWIKLVPQVSAPIYDCDDPNTIPIGKCVSTTYFCNGPYSIDASGCYFCSCVEILIMPEGAMTIGMLLYLLDTGGPIQSNQVYCCGGQPGG